MDHFICRMCDQVFTETEIQEAVQLRRSRTGTLVRFKDGSLHDVRRLSRAAHERWHVSRGIDFP